MSNTVAKRLVLTVLLAGLTIVPRQANAQRYGKTPPRYRPTQFEQDVPSVDLPLPVQEADPFPSVEEVVPPSLEGSPGDVEPPISEGGTIEPLVESTSEMPLFSDQDHLFDYDTMAAEEAAPVYSTGTWYWRGKWYTQMDFVMMAPSESREPITGILTRNTFTNAAVTVAGIIRDLDGTGTTREVYKVKDLVAQHYKPGTRMTLGRFLGRDAAGRDHALDFTFLGLFDWQESRDLLSRDGGSLWTILSSGTVLTGDPSRPDIDPLTRPFILADRQTFDYAADFNSFEMNYRIRTRPGRDQMAMQPDGNWVRHGQGSQIRSVLGGLRVMSLNESVDYRSSTAEDGDGRLLVHTNNDMIGVQLGAELLEKNDEWSWGLRGGTAGMMNILGRRSRLSEDRLFNVQAQKLDDENFVFFAQAGAFGVYQVRPNLHIRAAYDFMLLSGVARAPENISLLNGFSKLNSSGTLLLNGGSIGFEATW